MTEDKIVSGNRAIMFFDGAENATIDIMGKPAAAIKYKESYYPESNLPKFNEDWNLLIPIVEKIESMQTEFDGYFAFHICSNGCTVAGTRLNTSIENPHYAYFNDVTHETKLLATLKCVIDFITWYNTNKPQSK